ncbi:DUF3846 domain-containing protein [Planctomonas deserti]|uniref:DUF3846 domain-containing protein n=1 Tax=Planctomonas deserti TaxID=2144185 RepID=UPI000D3CD646|nr:DUF3846 domain-containing protein [Planctomonas deserti]
MVRSIVIPHDQARPAHVCELADLGAFQAAVDGSLEPLEIPTLDVTVYMNEDARRERRPLNVRATALWWYYSAVPTEFPLILGDVALAGSAHDLTGDSGDIPPLVEQQIFGSDLYRVQGTRGCDRHTWLDTYARFDNLFDAATWCTLFRATMGRASQFRLSSEPALFDSRSFGGEQAW